MKVSKEHCDDIDHGALLLQGSWSFVIKVAMEHCDEGDHGEL